MMKYQIITIIISLTFLMAGCSKKDNPFAPRRSMGNAEYNYIFTPAGFNINRGAPDEMDITVVGISDDPAVVGFSVESRWSSHYNWRPMMLEDEDPARQEQGVNIKLYSDYLREDSHIPPGGTGTSPVINNIYRDGTLKRLIYTEPNIIVEVNDPDLYVARSYVVKALDAYGDYTRAKEYTFRLVRVRCAFILYSSGTAALALTTDDGYGGVVGKVINYNSVTYDAKIQLEMLPLLKAMHEFQQWYASDNTFWRFWVVDVVDKHDNVDPGGISVSYDPPLGGSYNGIDVSSKAGKYIDFTIEKLATSEEEE